MTECVRVRVRMVTAALLVLLLVQLPGFLADVKASLHRRKLLQPYSQGELSSTTQADYDGPTSSSLRPQRTAGFSSQYADSGDAEPSTAGSSYPRTPYATDNSVSIGSPGSADPKPSYASSTPSAAIGRSNPGLGISSESETDTKTAGTLPGTRGAAIGTSGGLLGQIFETANTTITTTLNETLGNLTDALGSSLASLNGSATDNATSGLDSNTTTALPAEVADEVLNATGTGPLGVAQGVLEANDTTAGVSTAGNGTAGTGDAVIAGNGAVADTAIAGNGTVAGIGTAVRSGLAGISSPLSQSLSSLGTSLNQRPASTAVLPGLTSSPTSGGAAGAGSAGGSP